MYLIQISKHRRYVTITKSYIPSTSNYSDLVHIRAGTTTEGGWKIHESKRNCI